MHEGIYLFKNGVDPYSGGVFYQVRSTDPSPTNFVLNHHVLIPPSLLNPYHVAVSPLSVNIFDSPSVKPSVEPSSLDTGRCGWRVRSRGDLESEEWCE